VIHHSEAVLGDMNEWSEQMHGKTGLTEKCRRSKVSLKDAEDQVHRPSPSHHVYGVIWYGVIWYGSPGEASKDQAASSIFSSISCTTGCTVV
jgi:hypothetical protein